MCIVVARKITTHVVLDIINCIGPEISRAMYFGQRSRNHIEIAAADSRPHD